MVAKVRKTIDVAGYGLTEALPDIFPAPEIARRAPTTADRLDLGQIWVDKVTGSSYILTQISAGSALWQLIGGSGAGVFTSIDITVGPNSIIGTTTVDGDWDWATGNVSISTGDLTVDPGALTVAGLSTLGAVTQVGAASINATGAAATAIGNAGSTTTILGTVDINNVASSGNTRIGVAPGDGTVTIGNTTGNTAVVGSLTASAGLTATAGGVTATAGDITATDGNIIVTSAARGIQVNPTVSATGGTPRTVNTRFGQAVFTDVIATLTYVPLEVSNSLITATSVILASISCLETNVALSIVGITPGAGNVLFEVYNAGSAGSTNPVLINFWVLN